MVYNEKSDKCYRLSDVVVLTESLKKAIDSVGCDLRCFDWMSYNPDFHINNQTKKAA